MPDSALLYKEIRTHPGNPGPIACLKPLSLSIQVKLNVHKKRIHPGLPVFVAAEPTPPQPAQEQQSFCFFFFNKRNK